MSSQDRLENVLRDIHVMISKSEKYDADRIVVSKNDIFNLIDRLNASIYEIMDEYELTQQSRDRALRENKKEGDKIIWDASRQAEDIYAASVMYTEEALNHLNVMVEEADQTIGRLYKEFQNNMKQQQETIRENHLELKSQLQLLADTEKYLKLIEERNREIERERSDKKKGRKTLDKFGERRAVIKPEIKINEEYFRKAGIPIIKDEDEKKDDDPEYMEPLPDEGVIESTLKKAEEEMSHTVLEEKILTDNADSVNSMAEVNEGRGNPAASGAGKKTALGADDVSAEGMSVSVRAGNGMPAMNKLEGSEIASGDVGSRLSAAGYADSESGRAVSSGSASGEYIVPQITSGEFVSSGITSGEAMSSGITSEEYIDSELLQGRSVDANITPGRYTDSELLAGGSVTSEGFSDSGAAPVKYEDTEVLSGSVGSKISSSGEYSDFEESSKGAADNGRMSPVTEMSALDSLSSEAYAGQMIQEDEEISETVKADLDEEYFKWKNNGQNEESVHPHHEKLSLLDKLMGKKKSF